MMAARLPETHFACFCRRTRRDTALVPGRGGAPERCRQQGARSFGGRRSRQRPSHVVAGGRSAGLSRRSRRFSRRGGFVWPRVVFSRVAGPEIRRKAAVPLGFPMLTVVCGCVAPSRPRAAAFQGGRMPRSPPGPCEPALRIWPRPSTVPEDDAIRPLVRRPSPSPSAGVPGWTRRQSKVTA